MFKENLTEEELNVARLNGFILTGKKGVGKTTLLNVLFGQEVADTRMNVCARVIKSQVYYLKLKNGSCISLVDTPGLSDSDNIFNKQNEYDNIHLKYIEAAISEEKIHIKGILFLTNFQCIRLDKSEQEALINYNKLFP